MHRDMYVFVSLKYAQQDEMQKYIFFHALTDDTVDLSASPEEQLHNAGLSVARRHWRM